MNDIHSQVYKEIAARTGVDLEVVEKICRSQMDFLAKTMAEGNKFSVRLKYWGIWGVKYGRAEKIAKNRERRELRLLNEEQIKIQNSQGQPNT